MDTISIWTYLFIYVKPFKDSSEADASEGYQKVLKRGLLETFR